ncbi:putative ribosomal protein S4 [Ordospora pajunii]|uniref:putative ribosomal protein S4 n=1 Tax=Ordospora pajunii TaxID=3039483 RepID=UPI0029528D9D|nr:putative ribosomal protein S4 [Ordospora pajunii]KAH9411024.1 putative ribosomal protein S4 [Ordospora pajunii]
MTTGHKDHLKRLAAPKSWMLGKLGGVFALKPASGPHSAKRCIPLGYLVSRFLKYAGNRKELRIILEGNNVKVNGRVRTDPHFPVGLFDVLSIDKTGEHFRVFYTVSKKFHLHKIASSEAEYRLAKVVKKYSHLNVPYVVSSCGLNIRFCDPAIRIGDTIRIDNGSGKVSGYITPGVDKVVYVLNGRSKGCIGVVNTINKHADAKIYGMTDFAGHSFSCADKNCVFIGESRDDIWITLLKENGIKYSELEKINMRLGEMIDAEVAEENE